MHVRNIVVPCKSAEEATILYEALRLDEEPNPETITKTLSLNQHELLMYMFFFVKFHFLF